MRYDYYAGGDSALTPDWELSTHSMLAMNMNIRLMVMMVIVIVMVMVMVMMMVMVIMSTLGMLVMGQSDKF